MLPLCDPSSYDYWHITTHTQHPSRPQGVSHRSRESRHQPKADQSPTTAGLFRRILNPIAAVAILSVSLAPHVSAANRALIIGVGEHELQRLNLPGIDLDVAMMQDVAKTLGFKSNEITTLQDGEATLAAITREIGKLDSAGPDDHVLVYFSGHGDHIPDTNDDEEDGQDEILVPHDVRIVDGTVENALVDDDFGMLLAQIRSRHLLLLIDACHSGTATKSFANLGQTGKSKYAGLSGAMSNAAPVRGGAAARNLVVEERQQPGHVLLSAALDSELAQATSEGSAFTLGVFHTVNGAGADRNITPRQLASGVQVFVREKLDELGRTVHTPQLSGADDRLSTNIFFAEPAAVGPMRQRLDELAARMTAIGASAERDTYRVGESVIMTFEVPVAGYLNVVNVNAEDNAMVLFPNKFHSNNLVARGTPPPADPGDAVRHHRTRAARRQHHLRVSDREALGSVQVHRSGQGRERPDRRYPRAPVAVRLHADAQSRAGGQDRRDSLMAAR